MTSAFTSWLKEHYAPLSHRSDYWRRGRTPEKLGIGELSVGELVQFANAGERCWQA